MQSYTPLITTHLSFTFPIYITSHLPSLHTIPLAQAHRPAIPLIDMAPKRRPNKSSSSAAKAGPSSSAGPGPSTSTSLPKARSRPKQITSVPDPIIPDDFEADAEADLASDLANAAYSGGIRELKAMASAPSRLARYAPQLNSLHAKQFRFEVPKPVDQPDLPRGVNLFPAVPLAEPDGVGESEDALARLLLRDEEDGRGHARQVQEGEETEEAAAEEAEEEDLFDDELDPDFGLDPEDLLDERDAPEQLARMETERRAMAATKARLDARSAPIPPAIRDAYRSPFASLAVDAAAGENPRASWEYGQHERQDMAVHHFLTSVALGIPVDLLPEIRASYKAVLARCKDLPAFRVNADCTQISLVDPAHKSSLCPSIILADTLRPDGRVVHHLEALLAYGFVSEGRVKEMFAKAVARTAKPIITYVDLVGLDESSRPPSADTIDLPGLYGLNPIGTLMYLGMTFSQGLKRRVYQHRRINFPVSSKMGITQQYVKDTGGVWPGQQIAIMWHGTRCPLSDIIIPPGALYGMETVLLIMTGATLAVPKGIASVLAKTPPPPAFTIDPSRIDRPIIGLNSNWADTTGAFLRQSSLSISAARDFIRVLIASNKKPELEDLPEWRPANGPLDPDNHAAEVLYREMFRGIVSPHIAISTLYKYVQLRIMTLRRAVFDLRTEMRGFDGDLLPGKNALLWIRPKWTKVPGRGKTWE